MKDFPISVGTKIKNTSKMSIQTLEDAVDSIKNDEQLAKIIKTLRSITDDNLKRDYKAENLPYLNLGLFKDNIRKDENLLSTNFMIIDVDKISTDKFNELKDRLDQDNKIFIYFVSPSGNGYKVVYKFAETITDPNHFNDNYLHYSEMFEKEYDVETDSSTQDVSHACFFSYDPDIYLNEDADELDVIDAVEVKKTQEEEQKI